MKRTLAAGIVLMTAALATADKDGIDLKFGKDDLGRAPSGWTAAKTGTGNGGVWKVVADESVPSKSGFALAQTAVSPNQVFNICVADGPNLKDVEVIVSFKSVKGEIDQGGGIVWRYQDAKNYYVARVNPLEENFRVYKVVDGKRSKELQNAELNIPDGVWRSLKIKMTGDHIECFLDGKKYLDVKDATIGKAGKVGLWTKADAQTLFDRFVVSGK